MLVVWTGSIVFLDAVCTDRFYAITFDFARATRLARYEDSESRRALVTSALWHDVRL